MIVSIKNRVTEALVPLFSGQDIVVGIDSSKTNTAIAVGDMEREFLSWIELNGVYDGTSEHDTLILCKKQRAALRILLQGANIKYAGIEDIVSKIEKGRETGMTQHTSRFKITAVFMSLIALLQDDFGITPLLINNKSWKHEILPEEFRKLNIGKGSLAYFRSIGSPLGACTDDVTDAACILEFVYNAKGIRKGKHIVEREVPLYQHSKILVSMKTAERFRNVELLFLYNKNMTLVDNAIVMSNILAHSGKKVATADVSIEDLSLKDIYTYCAGEFEKAETRLKLCVMNGR